jgi:hypothetical protein
MKNYIRNICVKNLNSALLIATSLSFLSCGQKADEKINAETSVEGFNVGGVTCNFSQPKNEVYDRFNIKIEVKDDHKSAKMEYNYDKINDNKIKNVTEKISLKRFFVLPGVNPKSSFVGQNGNHKVVANFVYAGGQIRSGSVSIDDKSQIFLKCK